MRSVDSLRRLDVRRWLPFLVPLAAVALAGCRPRHRGTIVAKAHVPAGDTVQIVPLLLAGEDQMHRGRIPVLRSAREHFAIQVKQADGTVEMYFLHSKPVFDALAVGDFYKYDRKTARKRPYVVTVRLTPDEFDRVKAVPGEFRPPDQGTTGNHEGTKGTKPPRLAPPRAAGDSSPPAEGSM